jgi:hypothetical protein
VRLKKPSSDDPNFGFDDQTCLGDGNWGDFGDFGDDSGS